MRRGMSRTELRERTRGGGGAAQEDRGQGGGGAGRRIDRLYQTCGGGIRRAGIPGGRYQTRGGIRRAEVSIPRGRYQTRGGIISDARRYETRGAEGGGGGGGQEDR